MKVEFISKCGTWREVADCCRETIGKEVGDKEPSSFWKRRILMSEHSPIRTIHFNLRWVSIKSWIVTHFVRHWLGIVHFVTTQRNDRTGIDRDKKPQDSLINNRIHINPQALINISRKRLCKGNPHIETRKSWEKMIETLKEIEPELYSVLVPECIYRGWCPEFKCCGYHKTKEFKEKLFKYRKGIND